MRKTGYTRRNLFLLFLTEFQDILLIEISRKSAGKSKTSCLESSEFFLILRLCHVIKSKSRSSMRVIMSLCNMLTLTLFIRHSLCCFSNINQNFTLSKDLNRKLIPGTIFSVITFLWCLFAFVMSQLTAENVGLMRSNLAGNFKPSKT